MINNNIRSERSRNIISLDDRLINLTNKETNEDYGYFYKNMCGRIYYYTEDYDVIFIMDDKLYKYEIKEIE